MDYKTLEKLLENDHFNGTSFLISDYASNAEKEKKYKKDRKLKIKQLLVKINNSLKDNANV